MTRYVLRVPPGAWLLQTAAGSALGRMVIRLGRRFGFRTINVVRRREQAQELLREGADAVVATGEDSLTERVRVLTNGEGVAFAMDAVGGSTGSEVAAAGAGGRMVVYGTLSGEPMRIDPRTLMVGQKRVEGFWMSEWVKKQSSYDVFPVPHTGQADPVGRTGDGGRGDVSTERRAHRGSAGGGAGAAGEGAAAHRLALMRDHAGR